MTPISVRLTDPERYAAFRELSLSDKQRMGWVEVETEDRPGPPKYIRGRLPFPTGTVPQVLRYWIRLSGGGRWLLAKIHQYKLPDGSIRGGPDPLYIRLYDVTLTRVEKRS